jgi:hypothetical protein
MKRLAALLVLALFSGGWAPAGQGRRELVLIAGNPSHGPGEHKYRAGCLLLWKCLEGFPDLRVTVVENGWPEDKEC